ncbi:MAG: hypothetical protein ACRC28_08500 [Clostridium sp.]|uniref:hypothetical protein n=1 Tax=Clostridium sp. TaxID=1506 RepID=UPI003F3A13E3
MAFSFKDLKGCFCDDDDRRELRFFSRLPFAKAIDLCKYQPSIATVVSSDVEPTVSSVKLITTPVAISFEGQKLTGYKLLIDISIFQKIIYASGDCEAKTSSVLKYTDIKSVYVVLPAVYNETALCSLVRNNRFLINPIVEDYSVRVKGPYSLYSYLSLIVDVQLY